MFTRLRALWPKGYQRRILENSHQNGDYLKQAMRKHCPPTGFILVALVFCAGSFWARQHVSIKTLAAQTSKHHN